MKKILNYSFVLLAGLTLSLACSKIEETPADSEVINNPEGQGEQPQSPEEMVTITVSMPEEGLTKVAFEQDPKNKDGAVKLTWEEGDKILVNDTEFTLVSGAGSKTASFSGPEVTASSYTIAYNGGAFADEQTQAADADTKHLAYVISLTGVNTYQDVEFTQAWATNHGSGTLTQSSIFRLRAQMPSGVAANVTAVKIEALDADDVAVNIFGGSNVLQVNLTTPGDADTDGILDIYANLPTSAATIPAGTAFFVRFKTSDRGDVWSYTRYHVFSSALTLTPGTVNALKLNCTATDKHAGNKTVCDGTTAAKAYLIADGYQLATINSYASTTAKTYIKMIADVDMDGITHTPINESISGYTINLDFDGNNKTISNLGKCLFYVFKGSIYDLTLDGSTVTNRGIFAEYCQGTGHSITNVDITGGSMTTTSANGAALIGRINNGSGTTVTITDCDIINTTVSGAAQTGGLIGSADATVVVSNCTVVKSGEGTSSVTASGSNCGGLIGQTTGNVTITDCTVSGTSVTGTGVVGGVVGFANSLVTISGSKYTGGTVQASARYCGGFVGSTANLASVFSDCQVEDATIKTTCTDDPRCAGFVGQLQTNCQVKGCTVGTSANKVTVSTPQPASSKVLNCGGFVGVNYGTITKNGDTRSKAYAKITSANTSGQQLNLGGFVGFHRGTIEFCDAVVDMSGLQGQYIGGFSGYSTTDAKAYYNTITGSIKGNNYTGGFVAYVDSGSNEFENNEVLSGTIVNGQSAVGGFAGYVKVGTYKGNTVAGTITVRGNNGGGFVGTTEGGTFTDCSTSAAVTGNGTVIGGFVGNGVVANMTRCSSSGAVVKNSSDGNIIGGFAGTIETCTLDACFATGSITTTAVTAEYVGGFVGDVRPATGDTASFQNCYATGAVNGSGRWTAGFIGYIYRAADNCGDVEISKCHATGNVSVTGKQYVAAFIGRTYMVSGSHLTIEKCYATGNVSSNQSYASAFIGEIGEATTCTISDCYSTGNIIGANQQRGGLIAIVNANANTSATISRCYSTSSLSDGSFRLGGLIGNIATKNCSVDHCAAWNGAVVATAYSYNTNWSSGTIVGTAHPNCTLTDNYRNPDMTMTMWWVPAADYNHPNVEGTTHPLVIRNNEQPYTYTEATVTSLGAPYQFPYHGKVEAGKTLSQLASTTLGWSSDVWDFSGPLPLLK